MQTTSFTQPGLEYNADLAAVERKRRIAQALQAQAMQPIEQAPVGAGQFATPISPYQSAAKLAQAFVAARNSKQADEEQRKVVEAQQARRSADMATLADALKGSAAKTIQPDPQEVAQSEDYGTPAPQASQVPAQSPQERLQQALGSLRDPAAQQIAAGILGKYAEAQVPQKPMPYNLKPGERRFDADGRLIAEGAAEKPAGSTGPRVVAPGGALVDEKGNVIFKAPEKPDSQVAVTPVTVIENGRAVVKDGRTGKVLGISPQDPKLAGQFNADTAALTSTTANMDRLATAANQVLNHPGLAGITGLRGKIPNIPGSNAADAEALLGTLKSQVGFGVLQDMRNNSKTGGALGSVSDAEGKRLEANLAALDKSQSLEQMQRSLKAIIDYTEQAKDRMRESFNLKHGGQGGLPTKPGDEPKPAASPASGASKKVKWSDL